MTVAVLLDETLYFERFSDLEQGSQLILSNVHLSTVHVLENGLDLGVLDVLEHDDGMTAWQLGEERLKVGGTRRQHHLMALHGGTAVAGESNIGERLILQEFIEHSQQIRTMVVPPKAILLRTATHDGKASVLAL